jgi:hypothetical protein
MVAAEYARMLELNSKRILCSYNLEGNMKQVRGCQWSGCRPSSWSMLAIRNEITPEKLLKISLAQG